MAGKRFKRTPAGVKRSAVERMKEGANKSALAKELAVSRETLYNWLERAAELPAPGREQRIRELEVKVASLEGALGRAGLETRFFKGALRRIEESRRKREENGGTASMPKSAAGSDRKAD